MSEHKVIKIIDQYMLVINYGKEDGANTGDLLEIYEEGEEINDPDTKKSLGTLDFIKGRVKVVNVYDKMSLCSSDYVQTISMIPAITSWTNRTETKALNVNGDDVTGGYKPNNKKISLGDPVRVYDYELDD